MALRPVRIVWLTILLGLIGAAILGTSAFDQNTDGATLPISKPTAPWIPAPSGGSDLSNPAVRRVLEYIFSLEQLSATNAPEVFSNAGHLVFDCREHGWRGDGDRNSVYRLWTGDPIIEANARTWFIRFEPQAHSTYVTIAEEITELPFDRDTGKPNHHRSPVRRLDVPTASLEDIRSLWDSDDLWHDELDYEEMDSCLDGSFYVADACIQGHYALRSFRCGGRMGAMWELIQQHFGQAPK